MSESHPSNVDPALEAVLAECLEAIESGQNPSAGEWAGKYPEFAEPLRELIANQQRLNDVIARLPAAPEDFNSRTVLSSDGPFEGPVDGVNRVRYFGDYELIEEIARGGMGVVFRGRQVSLNRLVAVKMILSGELASQDDVARFRLEAEAAANLDHPGIVPIYEIGEHQGQHYFSMKFIAGESLASRLKKLAAENVSTGSPRERVRHSVKLVSEVARAVHYAHQRGIIHRDLKPANILIDLEGRPHITDFGLAKRVTGDSQLTHTGAIVGTPSYMSPEQAAGGSVSVTTAADIYGLGAILYAVLTGKPPLEGSSPLETLQKVQNEEPQKPSRTCPDVDRDLDAICGKCLAKNPDDRYRSAGELADDLERWLRGESVQAAAPSAASVVWRWLCSNFRIAAAVLVLGVITGWLVVEPARWSQAHNVGSYLGIYRGSFPDEQPPALLESLANYSIFWGFATLIVGLGCYFSMGWLCDHLVRPKSSGPAALSGFALGSTAAVTAFFSGIGWTTISQHAVWPIKPDLELLAAAIDNDTTFSDGRKLADVYPGITARHVMKKAFADLETGVPFALGMGLLFSVNLMLLPALLQTTGAYWLRTRGDGPWRRFLYLAELSIPLAILLAWSGTLIYQRPSLLLWIMAMAVAAWIALESTRRTLRTTRQVVFVALTVLAVLAFVIAVTPGGLFRVSLFGGGEGGNTPALYMVGAIAATTAVFQGWPWWRYGIYAAWFLTLLSTFTGTGSAFPSTPAEVLASQRNSWISMGVTLALTALVAWIFHKTSDRRDAVKSGVLADNAPTPPPRRISRKHWAIVIGVMALAGAIVLPLAAARFHRHQKMVEAIDRMQPESLKEIRELVGQGADITTKGHDNTVAMVAAYWNDPELLNQALDAGVDPNTQDPFGNTALHFAAFAPSLEPTRLLLAAGANVNLQNNRGETPLMGAVRNAQYELTRMLLDTGAKVDVTSQNGESALSIAQTLTHSGPRPLRPDLNPDDFVRLLRGGQ
jgi:hypothetical protein